jgi:hypothetical protein
MHEAPFRPSGTTPDIVYAEVGRRSLSEQIIFSYCLTEIRNVVFGRGWRSMEDRDHPRYPRQIFVAEKFPATA